MLDQKKKLLSLTYVLQVSRIRIEFAYEIDRGQVQFTTKI